MATTTTTQTLADLGVGSLIADRYEITHQLGVGGFATVFAAFDREIERTVAIKVLNLAAMSAQANNDVQPFLERFRREARLAARIRHPNVVEIYDFGVLGGNSHPYMIMEMLDGYDLSDELKKNGALGAARALPLFCGALEALGEAHRLGIIHKDLKPANLFINRPGTRFEVLKVVDFGIAHIGESNESRMTQTGAMFGTPQYLSPEYVQTQVVTPAMDVYQMGLILVEMLTGLPVVNEDNPWQCAVKHVTRDINLPVELLDGPLGPIVKRALEYVPADRFPTAAEFAEALSRIDASTVGDASVPNQAWRKIDSASGQFTPIRDEAGAVATASPNTDAMRAALAGEIPAAVASQAHQVKLQTAMMPAPRDGEEIVAKSSGGSKTMMLVVLLVLGVLGAGAAIFASSGGSQPAEGEALVEGAKDQPIGQDEGLAAVPLPVEPLADNTEEDPAAEPAEVDLADDLNAHGAAALADSLPEDVPPQADDGRDAPPANVAAADNRAPVAPAEVTTKPAKQASAGSNRKTEPAPQRPAVQPAAVKPAQPAQPVVEKPADKAPTRPAGMRLAPDIKKKDDGLRVAP